MIILKKSKKSNVKGFVLVETLITTVFVATILSVIFVNFYPLIGEYERREKYDEVDSKYGAFWVKKMIQDSNTISINTNYGSFTHDLSPARQIDCVANNNSDSIYYEDPAKASMCEELKKQYGIEKIVVTAYSLKVLKGGLKKYANTNQYQNIYGMFDSEFQDYIAYLPEYSAFQSEHGSRFRILVEFNHKIKNGVGNEKNYKTFATMEVSK